MHGDDGEPWNRQVQLLVLHGVAVHGNIINPSVILSMHEYPPGPYEICVDFDQ